MYRRIAILLIAALFVPSVVMAGQISTPQKKKMMKKWGATERTLVLAYDAWMRQEEIDIVLGLKTDAERMDFMKELGWVEKWKNDLKNEEEIQAAIERQEVIEGMNQEQVFMAWDKPAKIRKDFKKEAYINVLNYEFERDRKGKEFRLVPDSQTSYKNEVFLKFVYMYNDAVFRIVNEGEEEDVLDDLPVEAKPEPTPEPEPEPDAEGAAEEGAAEEAPAEGEPKTE
jgi:hypothetical protein